MTHMPCGRALICGISGQDAAYLAEHLFLNGWEIHGTTRDASQDFWRLRTLGMLENVRIHEVQLQEQRQVFSLIDSLGPHVIYALSGQSSVGRSFEVPIETCESVMWPVINLLEAIRHGDRSIRIFNASSSECFGETTEAVKHDTDFNPCNPYGIGKVASAFFIKHYRETYGLHASNGYLFNHESPLRSPRFVSRKIADAVVRISRGARAPLVLGDLSIERDWGWAPEYVVCMQRMLAVAEPSDVVIATGRPISLESFVDAAFSHVGLDWRKYVVIDESLFRKGECRRIWGDVSHARARLGWEAGLAGRDVARAMVEHSLGLNV